MNCHSTLYGQVMEYHLDSFSRGKLTTIYASIDIDANERHIHIMSLNADGKSALTPQAENLVDAFFLKRN